MRWVSYAGVALLCVVIALVPGPSGVAGSNGDWLDSVEPEPWDAAGAELPLASPPAVPIDPRFSRRARAPEASSESALTDAGWQLFAAAQAGWGLRIVQATSSYDGMGRPWQYQGFVFVEERFAGTLSPQPMDSRTDGALDRVLLTGEGTVQATFRRYAPSDPLCCPSSNATVLYRIDWTGTAPVLVPTTITNAPAAVPTLDQATLKNASYELPDLGRVRLRDGRYEQAFGEGATQVTRVTYLLGAAGHLDGDGAEDAAVALAVDSGGSGTFVYLMAMHNQDGTAQHMGARFLGDRVWVPSMAIVEGQIIVHLLDFAPSDPRCCPSLEVTRRYRVDTSLAELP